MTHIYRYSLAISKIDGNSIGRIVEWVMAEDCSPDRSGIAGSRGLEKLTS